ncbi:MAG: iron-containing alcohol dehydrogenase [Actinomycetota bacterium]
MTNTLAASWPYPTQIRIAPGCVAELADRCEQHGIERPLIVTDPGMVDLPAFASVLAALPEATPVFSDIQPNPVGANIDAGSEVFRSGSHDAVIAVGGGSALDAGKVIAFHAGQTRPIWDFEDVGTNWQLADADAIAPVIAIPTTAGTGSEVGRAGVVINEATKRKMIIFHPDMLPVAVLADPNLTIGLPRFLTVGTGMDALSHSLEAYCATGFHPMGHGIAIEGCRLVVEHLPRVVADPEDLASRTQMMAAAMMGAAAFQKGLGGMHALSHPIGARYNTHHGMTNAVVMPYVLQANRAAIEESIGLLASYLSIGGGYDGFLQRILELRDTFDVPHTLADLGVDADAVDAIAAEAAVDPSGGGNPIPFTEELAGEVFSAAHAGDVDAPA